MQAWIEVDLDRIKSNLGVIKRQIGSGVGLIAVVKSNAYGQGITEVSQVVDEAGADMFAVVSLEEALAIRRVSQRPILIISYLESKEISEAIERGFVLSLYDQQLAPLIDRLAARLHKTARVHLKLETGMNRSGLLFEEAIELLTNQRRFPNLKIEAIFSHLYTSKDPKCSREQLRVMQNLVVETQQNVGLLPMHLISSGALGNFKEGFLDAVRVGLALYGVDPVIEGLASAFSCRSVVMQVKAVKKGQGISYDHIDKADRDMTIALVPIGYANGYSQSFTGKTQALVLGKKVKVIGKIGMNHLTLDVTNLEIKRGDEVVLVGRQKGVLGEAEISVDELARLTSMRHHEIITRLGQSTPRRYYGG